MDGNKCLYCDNIIPEGDMVCPICEHTLLKIGFILQSEKATEEEVQKAYKSLYGNIDDVEDMT